MQRTISVIPPVGYFLGSDEERPVSVEVRDRVQWALCSTARIWNRSVLLWCHS